jgi:hypothetical protein
MSDMLQRLILRTRDPLAGTTLRIEPLRASRYAQVPLASTNDTGISEIAAETIATAIATPIATTAALPDADRSPMSPSTHHSAHRPASTDDATNVASVPLKPIARTTTTPTQRAAQSHTQTAAPMEGAPKAIDPAREPTSPKHPMPASLDIATRHVFQPVATRSVTQPPPPSVGIRSTTERAAKTAGPVTTASISTNITLSIGHVEVRAAPSPAPARPAAFRPRASLDDVLNRKRGDR